MINQSQTIVEQIDSYINTYKSKQTTDESLKKSFIRSLNYIKDKILKNDYINNSVQYDLAQQIVDAYFKQYGIIYKKLDFIKEAKEKAQNELKREKL